MNNDIKVIQDEIIYTFKKSLNEIVDDMSLSDVNLMTYELKCILKVLDKLRTEKTPLGVVQGCNTQRMVQCVETGEIFESVREAGREKQVSPSSIVTCCKNPKKTARGHHWKYVHEKPKFKTRQHTIRCVETGERFKSPFEAGKKYGIKPTSLWSAVVKGETIEGYHFERIDEIKN